MNTVVPEFVYHGTVTGYIKVFEPRKRYTPGGADVLPRVYATDRPAIAAMHAFPWSSDEGVDIQERDGKLYLQVPTNLKERLNQNIYIYKLNAAPFALTEEELTGNTYHTEQSITPLEVQQFASVTEAVKYFGGEVEVVNS